MPGGAIDTPNYMSVMVLDPDGIGVQISGIAKPGDSGLKRESLTREAARG